MEFIISKRSAGSAKKYFFSNFTLFSYKLVNISLFLFRRDKIIDNLNIVNNFSLTSIILVFIYY
jgi:hypothetical protein